MTSRPLPPAGPAGLVPGRPWALLWLMAGFNVLNFVDRQLVGSLAPLLMADLQISRAQIGLLAGFAFVLCYTVAGMAIGIAADRWPRRAIVLGGVWLWSLMTAVSGAARGFADLAAARVFLGVGQAALTPAALPMLADALPSRRWGLATGIYYAGLPVGTALSLIVAGFVAPRFGWRACFYALGALGIAASSLLALVREPVRRQGAPPAAGRASGQSGAAQAFGATARELFRALRERPAFGLIVAGGACLAYASAAAIHGVTWLVQERGFRFESAAYTAGGVAVAAGLCGNLAGGWVADWCARRWRGGRGWSLVLLTLFFAPFSVAFYLLPPSSALFYVCWFVSSASTVAYFGPVFSSIQEVAPPQVGSSAVAFGLLVVNIAGVGSGSWLTGVIGDGAGLTAGLLASVGVTLVGVPAFLLAARRWPR
ncbi:MAG TPA: MFS transporter [Vicinamibacterales bacterium]|nr:MFS transporter [Vicinamibacterales bacterium]